MSELSMINLCIDVKVYIITLVTPSTLFALYSVCKEFRSLVIPAIDSFHNREKSNSLLCNDTVHYDNIPLYLHVKKLNPQLACHFAHSAARCGSLNVVQYYCCNSSDFYNKITLWNVAALAGQLEILKWAEHSGYYLNANMLCNYAARSNNIELVEWVHNKLKVSWNHFNCTNAARSNNFNMLKYLYNHGCNYDRRTCDYAASNNNLEMLKYLHENNCPWDTKTCYHAIEKDNLEMLKYLHENNCPWDESNYYLVIKNGNNEILRYLVQNGCPWDEYVYNYAIEHDIDLLQDFNQ